MSKKRYATIDFEEDSCRNTLLKVMSGFK